MGTFSRLGINAERYDKVRDFSKTVAITPVSAKTGEGMLDILEVIASFKKEAEVELPLTQRSESINSESDADNEEKSNVNSIIKEFNGKF